MYNMFEVGKEYEDADGAPWTILTNPMNVMGSMSMVVKRSFEAEWGIAVLENDDTATVLFEGGFTTLHADGVVSRQEALHRYSEREDAKTHFVSVDESLTG